MQTSNSFYMQLAIDEAWKYQLLTYPNPAVGACIVKDNKVLAVEAHKVAGAPHAEVNVIKSAFLSLFPNSSIRNLESSHDIHNYLIKNHNNIFNDCIIYVTLEPCNHIGKTPACANLLKELIFKKIVVGTLDPNKIASGGLKTIQNKNTEVICGCCKKEVDNLLLPFIKWQQNNLIFFKLAMRKDGSIDGGYITTKESLSKVHRLREKIDLLCIGGKTVREDRPTLDTRFAKNMQNPDILIYSKRKEFDKKIPLFNIKNREVTISNSLKLINNKKFIMIEGGFNMLDNLKKHIDILMLFISKKEMQNSKEFDINSLGFEHLYTDKTSEDTIIWLKNSNSKLDMV